LADAAAPEYPEPPSTPVLPSPLTDQSRQLEDILEHGTLSQADCDAYFGGQTDRETTLRCGKWMFFYDHLEVPGSPAELVDLIRQNAPVSVGKSLEQFGLFPDPYSDTALPVGLAQGPDMAGGVSTYTLTCGSCHFGKTNDGRYVVGSPNHQFAFGKFTLTVSTLPELAVQPEKVLAPAVESIVGPVRDEVFGAGLTQLGVIGEAIRLLPNLIATQASPPDDAGKLALAILPTGVMDPYSPPSLDDGVTIPVRMSPLWGIDPEGMKAAGSTHGAMLGSNGGAPDLQHILRTFAFIASKIRALPLGQNYDESKVAPLIEYILSLRPPAQEKTLDAEEVAQGKELFYQRCFMCHHGPGYAGTEVFDPEVIGTDPNIVGLVDPDDTGHAIYDVLTPPELTKGLRARRLSAVWSLSRLFHNGSASSLDDVFCLHGPRPPSPLGSGYSTAGHNFTCEGLSSEQKQHLIRFLESL
jgi:cytochrome c5